MAEYNPSKIIKDGNTYNFRDTTKIPLAGSNEISGSLIPSATETYNFGSPSYQWNNAYIKSLTINGVACGDILTHNVSEFVDVSSNQTVGGIKTFSDIPIVANGKTFVSKINADRTNGTQTGFSAYNGFKIVCNNDSQGWDNTAFAIHMPEYSPTRAIVSFKLFDCIEGSSSYKGFGFSKNGNDFQLFPTPSNAIGLGTSTNKWKSFNGINPGALSLPSGTVAMDLIGDVSVVGTEKKLSKDITVTGFVYADVSFSSTSSNRFNLFNLFNGTKKYGIWIPCDNGRIRQIMPISAGDRLEFNVLDDGSTINAIKLFACQGNV